MSAIPTRAEMFAAIRDANTDNPLAAAIAAAISAYGDALNEQAHRAGAIPDPIVLPKPTTEIEAFALELFVNELSMSGARVVVRDDLSTRTR
jgi:hypothetical protein